MNTESKQASSHFAAVYGSPGQSPRTIGPLRVFWPLAPICLAAGYLLRAAAPIPALSATQAGFLFIALAVGLAYFLRWSTRRLQNFLKGAEGEEKVARALSYLSSSHTVYNDVALDAKGAELDHIVVAPTGIFVIETKSWSGEISFENGQVVCDGIIPSRPPIKQVKNATAQLVEYLRRTQCPTVPVYPVLCFVDNTPLGGLSNVGGVRICTDTTLYELFENSLEQKVERGILSMINAELLRTCGEV